MPDWMYYLVIIYAFIILAIMLPTFALLIIGFSRLSSSRKKVSGDG